MVFKNALVLAVTPYSMTDNDTGELIEGVSVLFVPDLTENEDDNGIKGRKPIKCALAPDKVSLFTTVPALYDVDCDLSATSNGKPSLSYNNFTFASSFDLKPVPAGKK